MECENAALRERLAQQDAELHALKQPLRRAAPESLLSEPPRLISLVIQPHNQ